MKKQILASIIAGSILTTGAFAMQGNMRGDCQMPQMGQKGKMGQKGMHRRGGGKMMPLFGVLHKLNLTDTQRDKIRSIMDEQRKSRPKLSDAFTSTGFDKAKYEKIAKQIQDGKISSRANLVEKVYNVLTTKQKAQFKTLFELQEERMMTPKPKKRGNKNW